MQTTTPIYDSILEGLHTFGTKIVVDGHTINETSIMSLKRSRPGMPDNKPSIGGALSSTLNLTILPQAFTIPKMAEIDVYIQAKGKIGGVNATSEWLPQGVYFVDTRAHNETAGSLGTIEITAYDAMAKAEADYPDTNHDWPYLDQSVVAEIATTIGVTVDSRTNGFLSAGYLIDLPVGYTMRETLEHIAAAYGGNFVITAENKLLFVPLYGLDPDISGDYLADSSDNAITFGNEGWCILV